MANARAPTQTLENADFVIPPFGLFTEALSSRNSIAASLANRSEIADIKRSRIRAIIFKQTFRNAHAVFRVRRRTQSRFATNSVQLIMNSILGNFRLRVVKLMYN